MTLPCFPGEGKIVFQADVARKDFLYGSNLTNEFGLPFLFPQALYLDKESLKWKKVKRSAWRNLSPKVPVCGHSSLSPGCSLFRGCLVAKPIFLSLKVLF